MFVDFEKFVMSLLLLIEGTTNFIGPRLVGRGNSSAAD